MATRPRKPKKPKDDEAARRGSVEQIYKEVGARIRQLRDERQLSQESLAAEADLSQNLLARIERGSRRVPLHSLQALAAALGAPLRSLLPGEATESDLSPALQQSITKLQWDDQALLRKLADRLGRSTSAKR